MCKSNITSIDTYTSPLMGIFFIKLLTKIRQIVLNSFFTMDVIYFPTIIVQKKITKTYFILLFK